MEKSTVKSNIDSADINEEMRDKLKGDLIGDTMYSESFIIKTMMHLNNLEWSSELENDLCFIWDMTTEEAVCNYLFEISFPSLACSVINTVNENRLDEILIGIMANICIPKEIPDLSIDIVSGIVNNLESDDHLILIQVIRFIKVISYKYDSELLFFNDKVLNKFKFILNNSLNHELVEITLDALGHVTDRGKTKTGPLSGGLMGSTCIAINTINSKENCSDCLNYWLKILLNFSSEINETNNKLLLKELQSYIGDISKIICFVLKGCFNEDDIEPQFTGLKYIIEVLAYVCPVLNVRSKKIFLILLDGFSKVLNYNDVSEDVKQNYVEVLCFFISTYDLKDFTPAADTNFLKVLKYVKNSQYVCEYDYVYNLNYLITALENKK